VSLLSSAKAYAHPRQIAYLIFYVTNRCNFRCKFCFYYAEIEKGRKPEELTLSEIDQFASKLGPLLQLSLTGGEPFLRQDLDEVYLTFVRHTGARYITIPTNASLTDRMMKFLARVLPATPHSFLRLTFSIDGIEGEHDDHRSMPGSFAKIRESFRAISPLRKKFSNLVLDANSVFTAKTEDRLLDTLRYLDREFDFDNLSVTYARGKIKDPSLKTDAREKYIAVNEFLEALERKKERRALYPVWRGVRDVSRRNLIDTVFEDRFVTPCVAGRKLVVVGETGELQPCEILGKSMGNLREVDFDPYALLARAEARDLQRWIVKSRCKCSFECALGANVVWNPSQYPRLMLSALRNIGRD
jgi:MoaA/NifB/PqqE/SkfB family radical SAM enzyme